MTALEEFPDIPQSITGTAASTSPTLTTLPSGLTVITESTSPTSTISVTFPNAGSSNEMISEGGAALANKCLSLKSTPELSSLLILRTLENAGATPFTFAGRKGAGLGLTCPSGAGERLVPLLSPTSAFTKWDMKDAKKTAATTVSTAMGNAQTVLTESLYAAAYGAQSPLGRPFHTAATSSAAIQSFRERTYVTSGAVLAATGIADHDAFVKAVDESFAGVPTGAADESSATPAYMGGESRVYAPGAGLAHVAIAFEANYSSAVLSVLKSAIAASAPEGIEAFAAPGLVGVYGAGSGEVADTLCSVLTAPLSSEAIASAKAIAKASAIVALEDGSQSLANAMSTSVLEVGAFSAEAIGAAYDAVTDAEVKSALSAMLKSNPSVSAIGEISAVPYHATIAGRF